MSTRAKTLRPCLETMEERLPLSTALPQPQPPGRFPSGNPPPSPGGSNDPGNSSRLVATGSQTITYWGTWVA